MVSNDKNTELKVEKPELYFWLCQLFSVTSHGSVSPIYKLEKNLTAISKNFLGIPIKNILYIMYCYFRVLVAISEVIIGILF